MIIQYRGVIDEVPNHVHIHFIIISPEWFGRSYDCPSTSEVTREDMGWFVAFIPRVWYSGNG